MELTPDSSFQSIRGTVLAAGTVPQRWRSALLGTAEPHIRQAVRVTIQELGSLGELIAAVATIATLGYLALQIRQNTRSVRASSRLDIASGWRAHNRQMLDPAVYRSYLRGLRDYPDMRFDERSVFGNLIADHAVFFQGVFALYEEGQLDGQTYEDYLTWFTCQIATPGGSAFWQETSPFLVKGAAAAVNDRLERGEVPDVLQLSSNSLDD